jgi:hypothetical protein
VSGKRHVCCCTHAASTSRGAAPRLPKSRRTSQQRPRRRAPPRGGARLRQRLRRPQARRHDRAQRRQLRRHASRGAVAVAAGGVEGAEQGRHLLGGGRILGRGEHPLKSAKRQRDGARHLRRRDGATRGAGAGLEPGGERLAGAARGSRTLPSRARGGGRRAGQGGRAGPPAARGRARLDPLGHGAREALEVEGLCADDAGLKRLLPQHPGLGRLGRRHAQRRRRGRRAAGGLGGGAGRVRGGGRGGVELAGADVAGGGHVERHRVALRGGVGVWGLW